MQFGTHGFWRSIGWFSAALFAIEVVVVISLIPIYLSFHDIDGGTHDIKVPLPSLILRFWNDISQASATLFNRLTVVNTLDIARQLEFKLHLRPKSLIVSSVKLESSSLSDAKRKRCLVNCTESLLVLQTNVNYGLCGRIDHCKVRLYNAVVNGFNDYHSDSFPINLKFNDSTAITIDIVPYMLSSATTTTGDVDICLSNKLPDLYDTSIRELQNGLQMNYFSSVDLVNAYIARINEVNTKGPALRAVIEISPTALQAANASDMLRKNGTILSVLHGIPILLKDNIATRPEDGMNTTAGSFALLGSITPGDATVAKKLRDAGAILLGKTSLSEWANFRGNNIPNGWCARSNQSTSAFYAQGDACGSSTGSGIASSIGLAAGTLGTETDGSIICPSNRNNLVGIKPTVGLTSRNLVIPISHNQDSVGPMCRSVADAAAILTIIAGSDIDDNYTLSQPKIVPNYTQYLNKNGLKGARIGVLRKIFANSTFGGYPDYIVSEFNKTIETIFKKLGAIIVDPADLTTADAIASGDSENTVLKFDIKYDLEHYLSQLKSIPSNVKNLQDLINFNNDHRNIELPPGRDNQDLFLMAQNTTGLLDGNYTSALKADFELGGTDGIDALLIKFNLTALIAPSEGYTSAPAAIVGYPIITVPLGFLPPDTDVSTNANTTLLNLPIWPAPNFPFGLSFIGTAYSEARLIELAYSYEQATLASKKGKPFTAALPKTQLSDILCPK